MGRKTQIDKFIWNDEKFRALDDDCKLLFFFLITHPHTTSIGTLRNTIPGIASEIGWTVRKLRTCVERLSGRMNLVVDESSNLFVIVNFLKHNPPISPNVLRSWEAEVAFIPEGELKYKILNHVREFAETLTEGFREALPEVFRNACPDFGSLSGRMMESSIYIKELDSSKKSKKKNQELDKETLARLEKDFNVFWSEYPRKVGKKKAREAFFKIKPGQAKFRTIMSALQVHKTTADWTKDGGKWIPHPTTWINGERWEDEIQIESGESKKAKEAKLKRLEELEAKERERMKGGK